MLLWVILPEVVSMRLHAAEATSLKVQFIISSETKIQPEKHRVLLKLMQPSWINFLIKQPVLDWVDPLSKTSFSSF